MFIEMESVENGIVELISELGIRKLVMGAAADKHHSRFGFGTLLDLTLNQLFAVSLNFLVLLTLQENDRTQVQESHLRMPRSSCSLSNHVYLQRILNPYKVFGLLTFN